MRGILGNTVADPRWSMGDRRQVLWRTRGLARPSGAPQVKADAAPLWTCWSHTVSPKPVGDRHNRRRGASSICRQHGLHQAHAPRRRAVPAFISPVIQGPLHVHRVQGAQRRDRGGAAPVAGRMAPLDRRWGLPRYRARQQSDIHPRPSARWWRPTPINSDLSSRNWESKQRS